jgi:PAS domain S-box-containing protein
VWGASVEELRESPYSFVEYIHPDDREKALRSMERIADGEPDEIEYRVRPPDCDKRWVHGQTKPIEDDDGNVVRIAGYVRDITRHKEREEELGRMNRRYRTLVDSFPEGGVFLYDHDLRYVVAGGEALRQTGFTPEDIEGKKLEEVFPEEVVEVQREKYEAALDGEPQVFEQEFRGRWFRLHVLPVTDDDGDVMSGMVVSQDVTERKEREKRLRQAREKYHELFNSMNDTAWVIGTDGGILDVNDAAVDVLSYSRDELRSMKVHEVDPVVDESEGDSLVERVIEEEKTVFETVHETKDGERIPVEISSSPITYDAETAILSIGRDISDREERRKRLKEVASVVSHDLRNPLNVAQARLELAREEGDDEHFDAADDALGRMERMVDDVLTLARMGGEAEETEWVDLETVVMESWRSVEAPDATVTVEDDLTVAADRGRLQRLLENLFGNAVQHGSTAGYVTVTVGGLAEGFYVEDDGIGVPPEERDEVFSVGYSTTSDGTGFGLATVEQVAEAHGWNVRITRGDGGGARFEFRGVRTDG